MMSQKQMDSDAAWCAKRGNPPTLLAILADAYAKSAETDTGGAEPPDHEDLIPGKEL